MGADGATTVAISTGQVRCFLHTPDVIPGDLLHHRTDGVA